MSDEHIGPCGKYCAVVDECDARGHEITRLRAENERMREALEPFAKFELFVEGSPHFDSMKNETPVITTGDGNCSKWIYRKHLRRACAAFKSMTELQKSGAVNE